MIFRTYRVSQQTDDVESLQTDIMRFMAILGFCLMIIFAMVQSAPSEPIKTDPSITNQHLLEIQIEGLIAKFIQMKIKIDTQHSTLEETQQQLHKTKLQVANSLALLESLAIQLSQNQVALKVAKRKIQQMIKEANILEGKLERAYAPKEETVNESTVINNETISEIPAEEKQGLFLEFSSKQDLVSLLGENKVRFFIQSNNTYFEYIEDQGIVVSQVSGEIYQMANHTVPKQLINKFSKQMTLNRSITFAVLLSPDIQLQVSQLINKHTSGWLLIDKDSKVTHKSSR